MGEPMQPVVVGVDGSVPSMSAVDLAAEEAASRIAPLVIVHVCDPSTAERADPATAAHRLLAVAASRALSEHPAVPVTVELPSGETTDILVERGRQAGLLVVAHSVHCGGRTTRSRSVAHRVVSRATGPVVVHRPLDLSGLVQQPRPVLVGVACAPGDDAVVEFAFEEAARRGVPLVAVHIRRGSASSPDEADEADAALVEALRAWSDKYPQVAVRRSIRNGLDIPVCLTAASRSAQLVVVGRRHPDESLLHVAQVLTHRAGCSVAVVPV